MCMNWRTCLLSKAWQRIPTISCRLAVSFLIILNVLLQETQPVVAVIWFHNDACTDPVPCRESDHTCVGATCAKHWESCPPGTAQNGAVNMVADEGNCSWTGCGIGGCLDGWEELDRKDCFLEPQCVTHAGFCRNEYCCALRPQVTCCELLPCTPVYDDCQVPERRYSEDPSRSETGTVPIAHQGHADLAFYSVGEVPYGGSCEDVRLLGRCVCDDGRNVPGCEPTNSSSWFVRDATSPTANTNSTTTPPPPPTAADNNNTDPSSSPATISPNPPPLPPLLPSNLSFTCIVTPPPPPSSPSPSSSSAATAAAIAKASTAPAFNIGDNVDATGYPTRPDAAAKDPLSPTPQENAPPQQQDPPISTTLPSAPPPPPPTKRQHKQPEPHGGLVAGIVLACMLLAACSVGSVLWCCGLCPNLHVLRVQSMTSYEPIFTGQPDSPGLSYRMQSLPSGALAATEDVPWNRFCAAVGDVYRRLRYGKRYRDERTDNAAAAERYRALNSLRSRHHAGNGNGMVSGDGGDLRKGPSRGSPGAIPRVRNSANGPGMYDPDDDAALDEVFTIDDLRTGSSYVGNGGRPMGPRLPVSTAPPPFAFTSAVRRDAPTPAPIGGLWRLGRRAKEAAPAPAELEMEVVSLCLSAQQRPTVTAPSYAQSRGGGQDDVIQTRPLSLSEDEGAAERGRGGGGGIGRGGGAESDDSDLDAPLHWLPSPQITGQSGSTSGLQGRGGGGGDGGKGTAR